MTDDCLKQLYDSLLGIPQQVFHIFCDYYGEEFVDLAGFVSFDDFKIKMSNVTVQDLFYSHSGTALGTKSISDLTLEEAIALTIIKVGTDGIRAYTFTSGLQSKLNTSAIYIMVHFPTVRITNEYDKYIDVEDLFVKVPIDYAGTTTGFQINKATYSKKEFNARYIHSHVRSFNINNLPTFSLPCLGNGPIRGTIALLCTGFDEDIWKLFALEVENYVYTESLVGIPYNHLEDIPDVNSELSTQPSQITLPIRNQYDSAILNLFVEFQSHFLSKKLLRFNFVNDTYGIAMSMKDFTILLSNAFISWYNNKITTDRYHIPSFSYLRNEGILLPAIIKNNMVNYVQSGTRTTDWSKHGMRLFMFKGREITLTIKDIDSTEENKVYLLTTGIIQMILRNILTIVNKYNGSHTNSSSAPNGTTGTPKRIRII